MSVKFTSKFPKFKFYVKGKKVAFFGGVLETDEASVIEYIRKMPEFGISIADNTMKKQEANKEPIAEVETSSQAEGAKVLNTGVKGSTNKPSKLVNRKKR